MIKITNQAQILAELKEKGVVIIDPFIGGKLLEDLRLEFNSFLNSENKGAVFTPYSFGKCARVKRDEYDKPGFPATTGFFYNESFRQLAEAYLGGPVSLNEEMFIVKDVVGSRHIANDLHFDVLNTFKFFLYLSDTTVENGAFTCVPGSHKKTAEYRKAAGSNISYDNRDITRKLDLHEFPEPVAMEGKAGSLIIFDTDVWHQAGTVSKGERHVMRGHTRKIMGTQATSSTGLLSRLKNKLFKG